MTIVSKKSSYIIFSLVRWMHYKEMSITYVYIAMRLCDMVS